VIKKDITFTDYNDNPRQVTAFFHLSKSELIDLDVAREGGFAAYAKGIVDAEDRAGLVKAFRELIDMSYGIKSDDGQRFEKGPEILNRFKSSAAYSELFMSLASDEDAAAAFVNGIVPSDINVEAPQDKPMGPPPTPSTAVETTAVETTAVETTAEETKPVSFNQF
jgi:hypothetical protein